MTTARVALPLVLVLLVGLLVADAQRARESRQASASGDGVAVSAAVAANEFAFQMVVSNAHLPGRPDGEQDCQGAYEWARGTGLYLESWVRLRVTVSASRYTQIDGHSLSIRVLNRAYAEPSLFSVFECDIGHETEFDDPEIWDVEIPVDAFEVEVPLLSFQGPLAAVGLTKGEKMSFLVDVTRPGYDAGVLRFELVLHATVNGSERTYVLREGADPFVLLPEYGGAGFSPDIHYWCPGSPGRLVYHDGRSDVPSLGPPC